MSRKFKPTPENRAIKALFFTKYWHKVITLPVGQRCIEHEKQFLKDIAEALSVPVNRGIGLIDYNNGCFPNHTLYSSHYKTLLSSIQDRIQDLPRLISDHKINYTPDDFQALYVDYLHCCGYLERPKAHAPTKYHAEFLNIRLHPYQDKTPLQLARDKQRPDLVKKIIELAKACGVKLLADGMDLKDYLITKRTIIPQKVIDQGTDADLTISFGAFLEKHLEGQRRWPGLLSPDVLAEVVTVSPVKYAYYVAAAKGDVGLWNYLQNLSQVKVQVDKTTVFEECPSFPVSMVLTTKAVWDDRYLLPFVCMSKAITVDFLAVAHRFDLWQSFVPHLSSPIWPKEDRSALRVKLEGATLDAINNERFGEIPSGYRDSEGNTLLHLAAKISVKSAGIAYRAGWGSWDDVNHAGKTPLTVSDSQVIEARRGIFKMARYGGIQDAVSDQALRFLAEPYEDRHVAHLLVTMFFNKNTEFVLKVAARHSADADHFERLCRLYHCFDEARFLREQAELLRLAVSGGGIAGHNRNEKAVRLMMVDFLVNKMKVPSDEALWSAMRGKEGALTLPLLKTYSGKAINAPQAFDGQEVSLLYMARMQGKESEQILRPLLRQGADVSMIVSRFRKGLPFIEDAHSRYLNTLYKAFIKLIDKGDETSLGDFFDNFGVTWLNLYDPDTGMTPIHRLASKGKHALITHLYHSERTGPIISRHLLRQDHSAGRRMPIHYAVLAGQYDTFCQLMELIGQSHINDVDKDGNTVLHLAVAVNAKGAMITAIDKYCIDRKIKNADSLMADQVTPKGFFATNALKEAEHKATNEAKCCRVLLEVTSDHLKYKMFSQADLKEYNSLYQLYSSALSFMDCASSEGQKSIHSLFLGCIRLEDKVGTIGRLAQEKSQLIDMYLSDLAVLNLIISFPIAEYAWLMSESDARAREYIRMVRGLEWSNQAECVYFVKKINMLAKYMSPKVFQKELKSYPALLKSYQMALFFQYCIETPNFDKKHVEAVLQQLSNQGLRLGVADAGIMLGAPMIYYRFMKPRIAFKDHKVSLGYYSGNKVKLTCVADALLDALVHVSHANSMGQPGLTSQFRSDSVVYVGCINDALERSDGDEAPLKWGESTISIDSLLGGALYRRVQLLRECYRYGSIVSSALWMPVRVESDIVETTQRAYGEIQAKLRRETECRCDYFTPGQSQEIQAQIYAMDSKELGSILEHMREAYNAAARSVERAIEESQSFVSPAAHRIMIDSLYKLFHDYAALNNRVSPDIVTAPNDCCEYITHVSEAITLLLQQMFRGVNLGLAEAIIDSGQHAGEKWSVAVHLFNATVCKGMDALFSDAHIRYSLTIQQLLTLQGQFDSAEAEYITLSNDVQERPTLLQKRQALASFLSELNSSISALGRVIESRKQKLESGLVDREYNIEEERRAAADLYDQCTILTEVPFSRIKKDIRHYIKVVHKAYQSRGKEESRQQKLQEEAAEADRCQVLQEGAGRINVLLKRVGRYLADADCAIAVDLCGELNTLSALLGKSMFSSESRIDKLVMLEPHKIKQCKVDGFEKIKGMVDKMEAQLADSLAFFEEFVPKREKIKSDLMKKTKEVPPCLLTLIKSLSDHIKDSKTLHLLNTSLVGFYFELVEAHSRDIHGICLVEKLSPHEHATEGFDNAVVLESVNYQDLVKQCYKKFIESCLDMLNAKLPGYLSPTGNMKLREETCVKFIAEMGSVVSYRHGDNGVYLSCADISHMTGEGVERFIKKYAELLEVVDKGTLQLRQHADNERRKNIAEIARRCNACNKMILKINQHISSWNVEDSDVLARRLDVVRDAIPLKRSFFGGDLTRSSGKCLIEIPYNAGEAEKCENRRLNALIIQIKELQELFETSVADAAEKERQAVDKEAALVHAIKGPLEKLNQLLPSQERRHKKFVLSIHKDLEKAGIFPIRGWAIRAEDALLEFHVDRVSGDYTPEDVVKAVKDAQAKVSRLVEAYQKSDDAMTHLRESVAQYCNAAVEANKHLKQGEVQTRLSQLLGPPVNPHALLVTDKGSLSKIPMIVGYKPSILMEQDLYEATKLEDIRNFVIDCTEQIRKESSLILACIDSGKGLCLNIKAYRDYCKGLDTKLLKHPEKKERQVAIAAEFKNYQTMAVRAITADDAGRYAEAANKSKELLDELKGIMASREQEVARHLKSQRKEAIFDDLIRNIVVDVNQKLAKLHALISDHDPYSGLCQDLRTKVLCANHGLQRVICGDLSVHDEGYIVDCLQLCKRLSDQIHAAIGQVEGDRAREYADFVEQLRGEIRDCNVLIKSVNQGVSASSDFSLSDDLIDNVDCLRREVGKPASVFGRFKLSDSNALQAINFSNKQYTNDVLTKLITATKHISASLDRVTQEAKARSDNRAQWKQENHDTFIEAVGPLLPILNSVLAELYQKNAVIATDIFRDLRLGGVCATQRSPVESMIDSEASKSIDRNKRDRIVVMIELTIEKVKTMLLGASQYELSFNDLQHAITACDTEIIKANSCLSDKVHSKLSGRLEGVVTSVIGKSNKMRPFSLAKFNFNAALYRSRVPASDSVRAHCNTVNEVLLAIRQEIEALGVVIRHKNELVRCRNQHLIAVRQWQSDGLIGRSEQQDVYLSAVEAFDEYHDKLQQVVTLDDADYFKDAITDAADHEEKLNSLMEKRSVLRDQEAAQQEAQARLTVLNTFIDEQVNPALTTLPSQDDDSAVVRSCLSFRALLSCQNTGIAPITVDQCYGKTAGEYDVAIEQAQGLLRVIQEAQSVLDQQARQALNDKTDELVKQCEACNHQINDVNALLDSTSSLDAQLVTSLDAFRNQVKKSSWFGLASSSASQLQVIDVDRAHCQQTYTERQHVVALIDEVSTLHAALSGQIETIKVAQAAAAEAAALERTRRADELAAKEAAAQQARENLEKSQQAYFQHLSIGVGEFNARLAQIHDGVGEEANDIAELEALLQPIRAYFDCRAVRLLPLSITGHSVEASFSLEKANQQLSQLRVVEHRYSAIRLERIDAMKAANHGFKASLALFERRWDDEMDAPLIERQGVVKINQDKVSYIKACQGKGGGQPSCHGLSQMIDRVNTFSGYFDEIRNNTDGILAARRDMAQRCTNFSDMAVEPDARQMAQVEHSKSVFNQSDKHLTDIAAYAVALAKCHDALDKQYQAVVSDRDQLRQACQSIQQEVRVDCDQLPESQSALKAASTVLLAVDVMALQPEALAQHQHQLTSQQSAIREALLSQQQAQEVAKKINAAHASIDDLKASCQGLVAELQTMDPESATQLNHEQENLMQSLPEDGAALSDLNDFQRRIKDFQQRLQQVKKQKEGLLVKLTSKVASKTRDIEAQLERLGADGVALNTEYLREIHIVVMDETMSSVQQRLAQLDAFGEKVADAITEQQRLTAEEAARVAAEKEAVALANAQEKQAALSDVKGQVERINTLSKSVNDYFSAVHEAGLKPLSAVLISAYDRFAAQLAPRKKSGFFSSLFSGTTLTSQSHRLNAMRYDAQAFIDVGAEEIRAMTALSEPIIESLEEKIRDLKKDCRHQIEVLVTRLPGSELTKSESEILKQYTIKRKAWTKATALVPHAELLNDFIQLSDQIDSRLADESRAADEIAREAERLRAEFKRQVKDAVQQHKKGSHERSLIDQLIARFKALDKHKLPVNSYAVLVDEVNQLPRSSRLLESDSMSGSSAFGFSSSSSTGLNMIGSTAAPAPGKYASSPRKLLSGAARTFIAMVERISEELDALYDKRLAKKVTKDEREYFDRFRSLGLEIYTAAEQSGLTDKQIMQYNQAVMAAFIVTEHRSETAQGFVGCRIEIWRPYQDPVLRQSMIDKVNLIQIRYCEAYTKLAQTSLHDTIGQAAALSRLQYLSPIRTLNT